MVVTKSGRDRKRVCRKKPSSKKIKPQESSLEQKPKRKHHGWCSVEGQAKKNKLFVYSGTLHRTLVKRSKYKTQYIYLRKYPITFFKGHKNNAAVQKTVKRLWGDILPLPLLYVPRNICITFTARYACICPLPQHPKHLVLVMKDVFLPHHCVRLGQICQRLEDLGPKQYSKANVENARSDIVEALHLGIWVHYSPVPMVSRETRLQSEEVWQVIQEMFEYLKAHFAPEINSILKYHARPQFILKQMVAEHIRNVLGDTLKENPWLDMNSAFFTIACAVGSSKLWHLDWNDDSRLYVIISCVSPDEEGWEGGNWNLPQLGYRIRLEQGDLMFVLAWRLVHCASTMLKGRWMVFTCFTDCFIVNMLTKAPSYFDLQRLFNLYR
ncbi:hypothetical protein PUNSTDRAFT_137656 [Punctularia strigosozonata HHB-11173 SS5]|uniref:uncharacterized protein n=1 Tax=Punctularia strigosozonata (strain HHB-11173) TaxID=741275 RepID=UPI0004416FA4|nr:uncharacterized protein PUNSTDRAFT_137656 [Punctularia strigosozonata HHB-11173 SS5]EIN05548.1 hypothetical protein PUNSTDRAFT_137656 [Punctularia strigosozonata HHB-11173 SS5]